MFYDFLLDLHYHVGDSSSLILTFCGSLCYSAFVSPVQKSNTALEEAGLADIIVFYLFRFSDFFRSRRAIPFFALGLLIVFLPVPWHF